MADWKNHPIAIAAITAASTAIFFITVVTPVIEKHNTNQIKDLENKLKINLKQQKENHETQKELLLEHKKHLTQKEDIIKGQKTTISNLKSDIEKYKNEDRFSNKNPIPKGYRNIALFSDYKDIGTEYPEEEFNENTLYSSIDIKDKIFSSVTYYPAACQDAQVIKEIRFFYKSKLHEYIEATEEQLGQPGFKTITRPNKEEIEKSKDEKKSALLKIFSENFGKAAKETDEYSIYTINDSTGAEINNNGLYIFSRYTDDDLKKMCAGLLSCPLPDEKL